MIASGEVASWPEVREMAHVIREQSDRMVRILRQLLDFARRKSTERSPTDLVKLARETVALLEPLAAKRGVAVAVESGAFVLEAEVGEGQIQQVLTNLVMNAIQASPAGATVEVRLAARTIASNQGDGLERSVRRR